MSSSPQLKQWWQTTWAIVGAVAVVVTICSGSLYIYETVHTGAAASSAVATATAAELAQGTATSSVSPTATAIPAATATSTPSGPPCNSGAVCYRADWSHDMGGWTGSSSWAYIRPGVLGSTTNNQNGDFTGPTVWAPYTPTQANITIKVHVSAPRGLGISQFWICLREVTGANGNSGYCASIAWGATPYGGTFAYIDGPNGQALGQHHYDDSVFNPDQWDLVFTANAAHLTLSVNGSPSVATDDGTLLGPGAIGFVVIGDTYLEFSNCIVIGA